jgi:ABC-type antimicrobial peptide transport system permease subunit
LIGPLGFAGKNLSRRGFHSLLAFIGLTLSVTSTTLLLLLGQGLAARLGVVLSPKGTFGIDWLFFGYLILALVLIVIVGAVSTSYLVSSMLNQRMRDIGVIKAAGSLPRRLFSYVFAEGMLVVTGSCLVGAIVALVIYVAWSWPSVNLSSQVGAVPEAGATIFVFVPLASFILSYAAARYEVSKIIKSNTASTMTSQLSGLDLKSLGSPLRIKVFGSAFNLATRNVSRDREVNRTLIRISVCIFLSVVVLTGALVSADTSRDYVQRAMPANILLVAHSPVYDQYAKLGTAFSSTTPIPAFDYTNSTFIISQRLAAEFSALTGVVKVDTRLINMTTVEGYVRAHIITNETSGNYNNVLVPEADLGSEQALFVGVNASSVIGNWYTSDGFLNSKDNQSAIVAGDSLIGGIVQTPFNLAQVGALGTRYDVVSALVDPLNGGRVFYAGVRSMQTLLNVTGYNLLLIQTDNAPSTLSAVQQFAASNGLKVGSMNQLLNSNLDFLNNTWSYLFLLPVLTLALTSGILLSYLTTNFTRRFNDYLVLRILGAGAWYSLKLLLWEAWGLLAVCMVISIPLAWLVSIFFLVPDASISAVGQIQAIVLSVLVLSAVSLASALIYSRRLKMMTVKDLRT